MIWITAVYGACFVGIELGLRDAPILWFAALRALVAGAALVAVARIQRRPAPGSTRAWGLIVVIGLINVTIGFGAMFAGAAGPWIPAVVATGSSMRCRVKQPSARLR